MTATFSHHANRHAATAAAPPQDNAPPRVVLALPAFNEEEALGALLASVAEVMSDQPLDYHVIVVDDGSSDNTAQVARDASTLMPLTLSVHQQNQGLAGALRTGLEAAVNSCGPNDVVLTMDADNTQPPNLMPQMVAMIRGGADVVIASRFRPGAQVVGVPWNRELLSQAARWLFTIALPIPGVRDFTCGYRAYRASALKEAMADYGDHFVSETGFSCMVDVLLKLRGRGLNIQEVPIVLRYDMKGGASKMRVLRTVRQTLSLIARRRVGSRA